MKHSLLLDGIRALSRMDSDTERLIVPREDEIHSLLSRYLAELELFNPAYGLVGTTDPGELVVKHILDSLAPLGILRRLFAEAAAAEPQAADAGSGAGLPGIPLAIALPGIQFTLIERMGRRAGFLRSTAAVLGLSNVAVEEAEAEQTRPGRFSLIVFRALKPLEEPLLKNLSRLLLPGGVLAAYKGKLDKIEAEMQNLKPAAPAWEALPCPVPFLDEERHLVVIRPLH